MKKIFSMLSQGFILIVMFMISSTVSATQQSGKNPLELLTILMNEMRMKGPRRIIRAEDILTADPQILLTALTPYEKDELPQVRGQAYAFEWLLGKNASSSEIRKSVVEHLVGAYSDPDPNVAYHSDNYLLSFVAEDFTEKARAMLRQQINPEDLRREMMLVIGVANLQEYIPTLQRLRTSQADYDAVSTPGIWYGLDGWYARLALARMGSQEDIEHCIAMVESHPNNVIRVARLLNDLAYIRQPEIIKVLQKYLESNETVGGDDDVAEICYCWYALDLLAQILEDFPIQRQYGPVGHSPADVETARAWMNAQTEFKIKR